MPEDTDKVKTLDDTVPNGNGSEVIASYFGYVAKVLPDLNRIEVLMHLSDDGTESIRMFPYQRFVDAGVGYENAGFKYEIKKDISGKVSSSIISYSPHHGSDVGIDLSVFDDFQAQFQHSS